MLHLGSRVPRAFYKIQGLIASCKACQRTKLVGTLLSPSTASSGDHYLLSGSVVRHTGNGHFERAQKLIYLPATYIYCMRCVLTCMYIHVDISFLIDQLIRGAFGGGGVGRGGAFANTLAELSTPLEIFEIMYTAV